MSGTTPAMSVAQWHAIDRLQRMHYHPQLGQRNTDGSVRVSTVRKLGTGRMMLTVTTDGHLRQPHTQDKGTPVALRWNLGPRPHQHR